MGGARGVPVSTFVDPASHRALAALLAERPGGVNAIPGLSRRRAVADALDAQRRLVDAPGLRVADDVVPSRADHDIAVRTYRPADPQGPLVLYVHGGGMVMGSLDGGDVEAARLAELLDAEVVSVGYRLAPEHPYPAAVDDCHDVARWLLARVGDRPYVLYGGSAGGGLVLATALRLRDDGARPARLVMAPYPMVDHSDTSYSTRTLPPLGVWDREHNREAWTWYLGADLPDGCAAPLHADLAGLPPVFLDVGTADIFLDDTVDLARRLWRCGVPTELHVWPGAFHAAEHIAPEAPLSHAVWSARTDALRRAAAVEPTSETAPTA